MKRLQNPAIATLALFAISLAASAQTSPTPPSAPQPAPKSFFNRWATFYHQDWTTPASSDTTSPSPPAARRGLPSPLNSPPYPSADWSYGGSPTIGEPDGNSYPLQTAINGAAVSPKMGRTKLYGWLDPTLNFSTAGTAQGARNYPESNDI